MIVINEDLRGALHAVVRNPPEAKSVQDTRPKPMQPEAFHGIAGDIVRTIEPHTEADPAALLVQFLIAAGNAIGRGPYFRAGSDRHYPNLFGVLVGRSSKGRKGSSWSAMLEMLRPADPEWAADRVITGLSSGEGLIWAVRDPIEAEEPIRDKKTQEITAYQAIVKDRGVSDKRLMVLESEFASVLRIAERDGNTLSAVVRQAWDNGSLHTMTKNTPAKATGAHISVVGHVTKDELLKYLTRSESGNGFANRFLWVCVERSKLLPDGGRLHTVDLAPLITKLQSAIKHARVAGELTRDDEARELWHKVYPALTADQPGLFGAVTSRAEAQVLRISCLYALLDGRRVVSAVHLAAALAVWKYCEDSARFIFGDSLGDSTADSILQGLRRSPEGLTRLQISDGIFTRNKRGDEIERGLQVLVANGLARMERDTDTGGRPREIWVSSFNSFTS
jgi:Protein of unknown function (DUF3987)